MAPGKRKTKAKRKDDDDSNYLEETKLDDLDPDLPLYHDTSEPEEAEEGEKQPESRARQTSGQLLKTRKNPPSAAKMREEESNDMKIEREESQDNPDNMNEAVNEATIMRLMEQALTDPEMNSTWKKAIDYQLASGGNPGDNGSSDDDKKDEDDDDPPDDSSRTGQYIRRSSQPKITINGFNNGRIMNPEQLAFRSSLMDFGINQESADEIMRGGMSNIREIADLNKESMKSFMLGLKSISPICPPPDRIHYVKPRATDWNANPDNLELQQFRIKMMQSNMYPTWSDYNERCGVLSGHQYDEDNNVVWRLLCDTTRKGPGWEYKCFHFSHATCLHRYKHNAMVLNETYQDMKDSHYTGDARNCDWNKHKRNWTAFHGTIMRFEKITMNEAKTDAIDESKDYRDNFNECLILFTNRLGLKKLANGKNKRSSRSVYSIGTTGNKKQKTTKSFTGKLENKPYPTSAYKTMSKAQRQELYQMRQASKKKRALKAAENKKAKEAEKEGAGDSFGSKS
eukprot:jgi/Psemu1/4433/gm1.4433_g